MKQIKNKLIVFFLSIIFILFGLFFYGLIDKPEYNLKLKGTVERCAHMLGRYEHGKNIDCTALLENGKLVNFSSNSILSSGEKVLFIEYKRPVTGIKSYGRLKLYR